jgi:hypothetical protein
MPPMYPKVYNVILARSQITICLCCYGKTCINNVFLFFPSLQTTPASALYSPAATSDSSGFSERETTTTTSSGVAASSGTASFGNGLLLLDRPMTTNANNGLYSLPGHASLGGHARPMPPSYTTLPSSNAQQQQQPHYHNFSALMSINESSSSSGGTLGGHSGTLFSYHNPTLSASPYSTLPRRMMQQQEPYSQM